MLQVAPSARRHAARQRNPELRSARAKRDEGLMPEVERVWQANLKVYGADKVWKQVIREGVAVACCTVEWLMGRLGLQGARRGKTVRTTVPDRSTPCPLDPVNRQVKADRPNQLRVSDFHLRLDLAGLAVRGLRHRRVRLTRRRLARQYHHDHGLRARRPGAGALCPPACGPGCAGSLGQRLAAIEPSVGSRGDSYDNALAETINGLYKAEVIHRRGPWKSREAVELATLKWVAWYNTSA